MSAKKLQQELFAIVRQKINNPNEEVGELMNLLSVSRSTLYKRLSGEIGLNLDELMTIAKHYNISLDSIFHKKGKRLSMQFRSILEQPGSFGDFLAPIITNLKHLQDIPQKEVFYATNEIPLFHYFHFPKLALFKLYIWGKSIWEIERLQNNPFNFKLADQQFDTLIQDTLALYNTIPSTEFWGVHILDNTLNQIKYCLEGELFEDPQDAFVLLSEVEKLLFRLEKMAANAKKYIDRRYVGASFMLYHNEMLYTNNMILVKTEAGDGVYITYDNPNFMFNNEERLCQYTTRWFRKLKRSSQCISLESEKYRHLYFSDLHRRLKRAKEEMNLFNKYTY